MSAALPQRVLPFAAFAQWRQCRPRLTALPYSVLISRSVPGYIRGVVSALVAMRHVLVAAVPLSQIRVRHCRPKCKELKRAE